MNPDPRDEIDRAIDGVLAALTAGEPGRVSAASVREAMAERRRPGIPAWFAVAAVLLAGLGFLLRGWPAIENPPGSLARSAERSMPVKNRLLPSPEPSVSVAVVSAGRGASTHSVATATVSPAATSYEGLPGLAMASLDLPEPLSTSRLDSDPIHISHIEIFPLAVQSLSIDQEQ